MKFFFTFLFSTLLTVSFSQSVNQYFEKIRNNEAALTAFFSQMPKGGDLHNHYGGAIYAEPLLERAITENFYVNTETMKVAKERPTFGKWEQFSTLQSRGELDLYKQKIMQKWSVKDYNNVEYPSDKLFFETFDKLWPAADGNFEQGLLELKKRAIKENVSYIETQLSTIQCNINTGNLNKFNEALRKMAVSKNEKNIFRLLDTMYNYLLQEGIADNSPLIVGVNIVSPEDGETSLKDYWLHMIMFKYCHSRYPNVKYALHAGELTLGLVQPEDLTWHIRSAVYTAKANRIGHGVDIAYEDSCYDLLRYMSKNKIPIEINLVSNEFILKVKENRHPITLYKEFKVPIVISTDDAGVLRTNMTEQFVLLAKRYKDFSYSEIKQFVYNSINYSFIKDLDLKKQLLKDLDNRFKAFESNLPIKQPL